MAAVLSADGLLLLIMLIKLHSSTNKARGLNMEMSDGEGWQEVGYDLYFCLDYLPGLCESSSSVRGKLELEVVKPKTQESSLVSVHTVHVTQIDLNPS